MAAGEQPLANLSGQAIALGPLFSFRMFLPGKVHTAIGNGVAIAFDVPVTAIPRNQYVAGGVT